VIDLHCHLLPELDDGARNLAESLEMARLAVADGITVTACTPHILPGLYDNSGRAIRVAVAVLQSALDEAGIPLLLASGADAHVAPDIVAGLTSGRVPSLGESRYFLLEPPQSVVPPRFDEYVFAIISAGYVPIVTHPERLGWIESHYFVIEQAVHLGAWMQLTAGSLLGHFGKRARYWSERMLADGLVHVVASDAHNIDRRPPILSEACEVIAERVGRDEGAHLVITRPAGILRNLSPTEMPPPRRPDENRAVGFWKRAARQVGI
jgi:protein-tyrosine phosphatase